jgi:hypothetical protein
MRRRDQQCTLPGAVWILTDRPDPFPEDSPLRKSRPVRGPVVSVRAIYNTLRWIQGRPCLTCRITQGLGFGPAPRDVDGFPVAHSPGASRPASAVRSGSRKESARRFPRLFRVYIARRKAESLTRRRLPRNAFPGSCPASFAKFRSLFSFASGGIPRAFLPGCGALGARSPFARAPSRTGLGCVSGGILEW